MGRSLRTAAAPGAGPGGSRSTERPPGTRGPSGGGGRGAAPRPAVPHRPGPRRATPAAPPRACARPYRPAACGLAVTSGGGASGSRRGPAFPVPPRPPAPEAAAPARRRGRRRRPARPGPTERRSGEACKCGGVRDPRPGAAAGVAEGRSGARLRGACPVPVGSGSSGSPGAGSPGQRRSVL